MPFGKQLREIAGRGLGLVLEDAWRGSAHVIKLALSTPGREGLTESEHEATGGTGGKIGYGWTSSCVSDLVRVTSPKPVQS